MKNKRTEDTKGVDHHKLPVGEVLNRMGDPNARVNGEYTALPLFGYVSLRDKLNTPLMMLVLLLLGTDEAVEGETKEGEVPALKPIATLKVELPVFPETEEAIVIVLSRLGWDGRVWPRDKGWPEGTDDESTIKDLMGSADLKATFVFPPSEQGVTSMPVKVERSRGPFLMPPLPKEEGDVVDQVLLEKLRALCTDCKVFHRPPTRSLIYT